MTDTPALRIAGQIFGPGQGPLSCSTPRLSGKIRRKISENGILRVCVKIGNSPLVAQPDIDEDNMTRFHLQKRQQFGSFDQNFRGLYAYHGATPTPRRRFGRVCVVEPSASVLLQAEVSGNYSRAFTFVATCSGSQPKVFP